jgi:Anti-sigma factor NepR
MPEKTPAKPRKKPARAATGGEASPRRAPAAVDQYIAGQLKAIYDEVVAEPIPDRLLQLIGRLDSDPNS